LKKNTRKTFKVCGVEIHKNLEGLFTGCNHFTFLILWATFEKNTRKTFKVCGVEIHGKPV